MLATEPIPRTKAFAEIQAVDTIAADKFKRDYIATNTPLLMRKETADWPAMSKWSFDYFASLSLPSAFTWK